MSIEFSEHGSRIFTGKAKPDFEFKFVNKDNVETAKNELEKIGINIQEQE
ncbi:MAG: hypothetical protein WC356_03685 [Candidatus Micrarchaeia archaeon]